MSDECMSPLCETNVCCDSTCVGKKGIETQLRNDRHRAVDVGKHIKEPLINEARTACPTIRRVLWGQHGRMKKNEEMTNEQIHRERITIDRDNIMMTDTQWTTEMMTSATHSHRASRMWTITES
jgi:hypothetical protein